MKSQADGQTPALPVPQFIRHAPAHHNDNRTDEKTTRPWLELAHRLMARRNGFHATNDNARGR